jgi:UDP-N-acetyl-D-mannosaminuronic acid dehydrogenase
MPRFRVAVIGGCGHVGLPLSIAFAPHHDVLVYDTNPEAAELVKAGKMPFMDKGGEQGLREALALGMQVTTSSTGLAECDFLVVVIGTPVDEHLNPSFITFDKVIDQLAASMRPGQTLVLRSTVYPGTTDRVHRRLQRLGKDVEVVFCPERVAQGKALEEILSLPQLISAFSPKGFAACHRLFEPLGTELIELAPLEAELAKLFNNVYRYVTFAIANQFYMLTTEYDLDFYRVFHAMRHDYPRGAHLPAPGFAAGPCLFKDTMQLSAFNKNSFFLGHAAMLINEGLPQFVVGQMMKRWPDLRQKTVGILGMAFKGDSDDHRESLSYKLKKILQISAGEVLATDPFVRDKDLATEESVLATADILIIGAPHSRYRTLDFRGKPVVDIWNLMGQGGQI